MNAPLAAGPPPPPHEVIARLVYERAMEDGDIPWPDLPPEDREHLAEYARDILHAHIELLTVQGFKLVPPGAAPIPKTQEEAMAMIQAAKGFFDAQKRKGKLMNAAAPEPKLILPKGFH